MIEIGTAIVSYIEPAPGYAREFNEWYERDHFPATVLAGPGVFSGARFVATRRCKELRAPGTLFGDPARGSYLGVAWVLPGKQAEWDAWVAEEMKTIVAENRLFPHREHVHTGVYRFVSASGPVPAPAALDHPFSGVRAIAAYAEIAPTELTTVLLQSERTIMSSAEPPAHYLQLTFTPGDPCDGFTPPEGVGFASPFLATVPGTDRYTEEL